MGSIQDRAALPRLSSGAAAAIAVAGLAGTAVAFGVALDVGHADHDGLVATGRASAVLIPVAVGLHQWRSRAPQRFAPLLVLAGLLMVLVSLAERTRLRAHSAGRVGAWLSEYLTLVLLLVFPAGVLLRRGDRALAAAMALVLVLLYLPTALMVDAYPEPSAVSTCVSGCPANAFDVLRSEPGFVSDAMIPLREVATVLLALAVAGVMARRLRAASHLARLHPRPGARGRGRPRALARDVLRAAGLRRRARAADGPRLAPLPQARVPRGRARDGSGCAGASTSPPRSSALRSVCRAMGRRPRCGVACRNRSRTRRCGSSTTSTSEGTTAAGSTRAGGRWPRRSPARAR